MWNHHPKMLYDHKTQTQWQGPCDIALDEVIIQARILSHHEKISRKLCFDPHVATNIYLKSRIRHRNRTRKWRIYLTLITRIWVGELHYYLRKCLLWNHMITQNDIPKNSCQAFSYQKIMQKSSSPGLPPSYSIEGWLVIYHTSTLTWMMQWWVRGHQKISG